MPIIKVPDAFRDLQNTPAFSAETRCWSEHQPGRTMGGEPENPSTAASVARSPSKQHSSGSPPVEGDPFNDMTSSPESNVVDSCFGFPMMPSRWAECLAGMTLSEQPPSNERRPGMYKHSPEALLANNLGQGSFSLSGSCHETRAVNSGAQFPAQFPYLQNSAILDQTIQLPDMAEKLPVSVF